MYTPCDTSQQKRVRSPEELEGDRKVCAIVILSLGTIATILYFTIGSGRKYF